jgi:nitrile hydratase accessory protein
VNSRTLDDLRGVPRAADAPTFRDPWEARAFAMTIALHERGLFTWPEWAAALSSQIQLAQQAGDADLGDTYYQHWLNALETLLRTHQGFKAAVTSGGSNAVRVQLPSS